MSLFGGQRIPWSGAAVRAAASAPPMTPEGTPDAPRAGRWRGRATSTRHLAPSATPATITAALDSAELGFPADFFSLVQEMSDRSPDIVAVLGTRKRAVSQTAWTLEPGGPRARDRRIAEQVEQWIRQITNLETGLVHLLGAIEGGFAAAELEWAVLEEKGGMIARPRSFSLSPPSWFQPSPEDPRIWNLVDADNYLAGKPLTPDRWLTHLHQAKPGLPAQAGLGRVLLWFWLFSHYAIKDWTAYAEMYGAPIRLGKAAAGATSSQMDDVEDALAQLGVDAYAVLPPGWEVEFVGDSSNKSGADVYERLLAYLNRAIAKVVLGQTLTTEQGESGSYALGAVHNGVRLDLARSDCGQLARSLTAGLVEPICRLNFGPDAVCPRWVFQMEPPRDAEKDARAQAGRAEVFKRALDLGLPVSRAQVAEELQLREPSGADDLLERSSTPAEPPKDDEDDDDAGE